MFGLSWDERFKNYGQNSGFVHKPSGTLYLARMPQQLRDMCSSGTPSTSSNRRHDKGDIRSLDQRKKSDDRSRAGQRSNEDSSRVKHEESRS